MNVDHSEVGSANPGAVADALERLLELAVLVTDAIQEGLVEDGMTAARAELIWRLQRHGPMTQRELSEALRCTPRNVTSLVDALEGAGYVTRGPHPTDRRATLVSLTGKGRTAAAAWQAGHQAWAAALFGDLDAADLACFTTVLDRLLARLHGAASTTADRAG